MLTVSKITGGVAGAYADYLQGKAEPSTLGDYYLKDGERVEAQGRWISGAAAVGVERSTPVEAQHLRALMAVQRPNTGEPLRRAGGNGEAVAAIDATFSAPKSVSAIWAVASRELRADVERAHEAAVNRAIGYALEHVAMVRERVDARTVIHTSAADVVATSWRHTTARAVDGRPPDPQLHSHVLLHAAVRSDGRIVAVDSRRWFVHRRELGAAYRSELARELAGLGFSVRRGTGRGGRYFEIEGVPATLTDEWSSRHHQVRQAIAHRLEEKQVALEAIAAGSGPRASRAQQRLAELRAHGRLRPADDRRMGWSTRSAKSFATHQHLDGHWLSMARRVGFSTDRLQKQSASTHLGAAEPEALLSRLTEFDAKFSERDARAVALEVSAGVSTRDALAALRRLRAQGEIAELADGQLTTRSHRAEELAIIRCAARLVQAPVRSMPREIIVRECGRLDEELDAAGGALSQEQRVAIGAASSSNGLTLIVGQAGSGKSTTVMGIARIHQDAGQRVIVTSTAGLAAERLASELEAGGVATLAYSIAALHAAVKTGQVRLGPGVTVIHDEAALASTRDQHRLIGAVQASGARVIELGDPRQSRPVGASGLWPHLEDTAERRGARVALTRNVRARDPADRRDQARFRAGELQEALLGYTVRGRVTARARQRDAEERALEAAQADRLAGRNTLVIAQTSNDHLDELNARAQALRDQDGELGSEGVALAGRPYELRAGDHVQVRRGIRPPVGGDIRNGTVGKVLSVDAHRDRILLRLSDARVVPLNRDQIDHADLRLAYVQHPFLAQGQTSDTAHFIVCDNTTREGTYVGLTRAREQTQIYTSLEQLDPDGIDVGLFALADAVGRSEPSVPSISSPLAFEASFTEAEQDEPSPSINALAGARRSPLARSDRATSDSPVDGWRIETAAALRAHHDEDLRHGSLTESGAGVDTHALRPGHGISPQKENPQLESQREASEAPRAWRDDRTDGWEM